MWELSRDTASTAARLGVADGTTGSGIAQTADEFSQIFDGRLVYTGAT
ncbi:hypothetical protein [Mycobacterium conspicuum]|jgi:hypothetical protein|uniref:Uncharacterized protein n=1 Tax=Mycobacterium conspicuum TaxID=44010 RepID=A0A7I7YFP6_9MYCO|nr:hypothetical protein [Mycobacterium conspicuum]BBZ39803.1 hypothetical protein MCNS_28660 [Mycobacterium conspicuum]